MPQFWPRIVLSAWSFALLKIIAVSSPGPSFASGSIVRESGAVGESEFERRKTTIALSGRVSPDAFIFGAKSALPKIVT
jgi:hypothetical protein